MRGTLGERRRQLAASATVSAKSSVSALASRATSTSSDLAGHGRSAPAATTRGKDGVCTAKHHTSRACQATIRAAGHRRAPVRGFGFGEAHRARWRALLHESSAHGHAARANALVTPSEADSTGLWVSARAGPDVSHAGLSRAASAPAFPRGETLSQNQTVAATKQAEGRGPASPPGARLTHSPGATPPQLMDWELLAADEMAVEAATRRQLARHAAVGPAHPRELEGSAGSSSSNMVMAEPGTSKLGQSNGFVAKPAAAKPASSKHQAESTASLDDFFADLRRDFDGIHDGADEALRQSEDERTRLTSALDAAIAARCRAESERDEALARLRLRTH